MINKRIGICSRCMAEEVELTGTPQFKICKECFKELQEEERNNEMKAKDKTDYKKRCRDCAYLIENTKGNWACDVDGKECKDILFCEAVEESEG